MVLASRERNVIASRLKFASQYLLSAKMLLETPSQDADELFGKGSAKATEQMKIKMVMEALSKASEQCQVAIKELGGIKDEHTVW